MTRHFILMGDVTGSRKRNAHELHEQLKFLLDSCNEELRQSILSPYATTLGDEFQGISSSLHEAVRTVFFIEEIRLREGFDFEIRYVILHGEIETPINDKIAYGMMGEGLTRARDLLTYKGRDRPRFAFDLSDMRLSARLGQLCRVIDGLAKRWHPRDYPLVYDMLLHSNNAKVAFMYDKNKSQIWKRRRTLLVEEYRLIRNVVLDLATTAERAIDDSSI